MLAISIENETAQRGFAHDSIQIVSVFHSAEFASLRHQLDGLLLNTQIKKTHFKKWLSLNLIVLHRYFALDSNSELIIFELALCMNGRLTFSHDYC